MVVEALVTFLIILAGSWFLTEVLQGIWYESVVSGLLPRLLAASAILTALQLFTHIRLDTLVAESLPWVVVSGIVWAVVYYGFFQFSAGHALGLGLAAMLLLTCLSGMAADGFQGVGAGPIRPAPTSRTKSDATPKRTPRIGSGFVPFQVPTIESRGTQAPPPPSSIDPIVKPAEETKPASSGEIHKSQ